MEITIGVVAAIIGLQVLGFMMEFTMFLMEAAVGAVLFIAFLISWPFQHAYKKITNRSYRSTRSSTKKVYRSTHNGAEVVYSPGRSESKWKTVWKKRHKDGGTSTISIRTWVLRIWERFIDLFREEK